MTDRSESSGKAIRLIPRLDVKGVNVVKGVHLEGLRVIGKPGAFANNYYCQGADEIIYMDCVASLYGRNSLHDIVSEAAEHIFIPLTVGGGIRNIEDVRSLLKAGADKVAINTALFSTPRLITEVADRFGSQCMVVSIEVVKDDNGEYVCMTDNGREYTGVGVMEWIEKVTELGAGEILLTSVDQEGTGLGYDNELINMVASNTSIPVIASGGAGKLQHIESAISHGKADAVAVASMLHYDLAARLSNFDDTSEGNKAFLRRVNSEGSSQRKGIDAKSLVQIKSALFDKGYEIRLSEESL